MLCPKRGFRVCAATLDLLEANWDWLAGVAQTDVVVAAFFCFVRVMGDLASTEHTELLDRMARLCGRIWEAARPGCVEVGRDMVRLLQSVARVRQLRHCSGPLLAHLSTPYRPRARIEGLRVC